MAKTAASKSPKKPAKKRAPRARRQPVVQQPTLTGGDFIVELQVNEKRYDADGSTSIEAFQNLAAQFPNFLIIKTRAIVVLTNGNRSSRQIFFALQLRRLLKNYVAMQVWSKRLEAALK